MSLPEVPPSPGFGRRKGGKAHPTLPLSAFTPPNTSASDRFPLPPSPSAVQPEHVIDANVITANGDLSQWKEEVSLAFGDKIGGIVLSLEGVDISNVEKTLSTITSTASEVPILSILVPFSLADGAPSAPPTYLPTPTSSSSHPPVVLSATYTKSTPQAVSALKWALDNGYSVDLDVQADLRGKESEWEAFEDFFCKVLPPQDNTPAGKVILSNLLPPPDDFSLPIVKLLSHPTYQAYQSRMAALSLYADVIVKFQPPMWDTATPPTPAPPGMDSASSERSFQKDTSEKKEWKRRIKMYIGPALEAFGIQRIVYGSSPSPASQANSNAGDWYELARESFAELGVEQEGIDAIFYSNAKLAYS